MTQSVVFNFYAELTMQTVGVEHKRLVEQLKQQSHLIVYIELSNTVTFDSSGLALLLEAKRICRVANHILIIQGMPPKMVSLAEFCGLQSILVSE